VGKGVITTAALLLLAACGPGEEGGGEDTTSITVHYLGHASFLLTFGDGPRVLTDYGESHAYGLDSPVHSLGSVVPEMVTLSHQHADHAGGTLPEGVGRTLTGEEGPTSAGGLTITPIPTYEGSLEAPDNISFLFEFGGMRILHLGDCQGLMTSLAPEGSDGVEAAEALIRSLYPHRYDLVFLPIGFVSDILEEAATFATLLNADRIVPMHYWSPGDRDRFLELMEERRDSRGRPYRIQPAGGPELAMTARGESRGEGPPTPADERPPRIIGLTPGPAGG
jgi:L-ascorbate metabolism protein UlaG (beta-lactamase superfamily)